MDQIIGMRELRIGSSRIRVVWVIIDLIGAQDIHAQDSSPKGRYSGFSFFYYHLPSPLWWVITTIAVVVMPEGMFFDVFFFFQN